MPTPNPPIDGSEHGEHGQSCEPSDVSGLSWRLSVAVADVAVPPDIVERVRAGGRRRLRRHRVITVAAVAVVTAIASLLASVAHPLADHRFDPADRKPAEEVNDPYAWLLAGPTRGDLAHDRAYLQQVTREWKELTVAFPVDDLYGEPKVAWAGRTTVGKAAIVVQHKVVDPDGPGRTSRRLDTVLTGLSMGSNGSNVVCHFLTASSHASRMDRPYGGFMFGRTLVVFDDGQPAPTGYATQRLYADNGDIGWAWRELRFRGGVAVLTLPPDIEPARLRLTKLRNSDHVEFLAIAGQVAASGTPQFVWGSKEHSGAWDITGSRYKFTDLADELEQKLAAADPSSRLRSAPWRAYGGEPGTRAMAVGEFAYDNEPSHVYAILKYWDGTTRIVHGGIPDKRSLTPVVFRLPVKLDDEGLAEGDWIVISYGATLQRQPAHDSGWTLPQDNAVLVPHHDGNKIRVTRDGHQEVVHLE